MSYQPLEEGCAVQGANIEPPDLQTLIYAPAYVGQDEGDLV